MPVALQCQTQGIGQGIGKASVAQTFDWPNIAKLGRRFGNDLWTWWQVPFVYRSPAPADASQHARHVSTLFHAAAALEYSCAPTRGLMTVVLTVTHVRVMDC